MRSSLIALLVSLSCAASAQQFGGAPLTPAPATTPTGPLAFTPGKVLNPIDYGARCDGATDDTTALQAWASSIFYKAHLVIPGNCVFSGPLAFPTGIDDVVLDGGELTYAGANTNITAVKIGDVGHGGSCMANGWTIRGLRLTSLTKMIGGEALLLGDTCGFDISGLNTDNGGGWYIGLHAQGGRFMRMRAGILKGSNTGELVHGESSVQFTDWYQDETLVNNSAIGIDIAGNVGGFVAMSGDIIANGENVRISQDRVAVPNHQVFFGAGVSIDATDTTTFPGASGVGLHVTDPGNAASPGYIMLQGTWLSYANNQCALIDSTAQYWHVVMAGGTVITCGAAGALSTGAFDNESASSNIQIQFSGTRFGQNNGNDIYNVAGAKPVAVQGATFDTQGGKLDGGWTGSFVDSSGNTRISSSAALFLVSPNNNVLVTPNSSYAVILGPGGGTNCAPYFFAGRAVPGYASGGGTASCAYDFGTVALPFNNGFFNNVRGSAYYQTGAAPAASGACAIKSQSAGATGGLFQLSSTCSAATLTLTFTSYATTGWTCSAQAMTSADSIRQSGFTTNSASFTITGSANDWFGVACAGS